jgi:hypothetical protein
MKAPEDAEAIRRIEMASNKTRLHESPARELDGEIASSVRLSRGRNPQRPRQRKPANPFDFKTTHACHSPLIIERCVLTQCFFFGETT